MDFDNSWHALMRPGDAGAYFDLRPREKFQAGASSYSEINAWWLAEISRLIYRQESDEIGSAARGPTRDQILRSVGLREVTFINDAWAQCAVVRSGESAEAPFAILVFRGTQHPRDWLTDLEVIPLGWQGKGIVHRGFGSALLAVWERIEECLDALGGPVFYTGHSLGGALATLAASRRPPHALYTFGSPRTGNREFAATMRGMRAYRVVNNRDAVTAIPPSWSGFRHVGELRYIARGSRMLQNPPRGTVAADRQERSRAVPTSPDTRRRFVDPPQMMADHAPVNYVAHLERAVSLTSPSRPGPPLS